MALTVKKKISNFDGRTKPYLVVLFWFQIFLFQESNPVNQDV